MGAAPTVAWQHGMMVFRKQPAAVSATNCTQGACCVRGACLPVRCVIAWLVSPALVATYCRHVHMLLLPLPS